MQSLLCNSSLALLLLLLGGVQGLQVQDGQVGDAGEVLGCIGMVVRVVDLGVDDTCVLSPPGQGGFLVGEVKRVLPSTGQASKLCVIRVLSATSL